MILKGASAWAQTGVGAILIAAGVMQLGAEATFFRQAMPGYHLVREGFAGLLAFWFPRVEMSIGLLLVLGAIARLAGLLAHALLGVLRFTVRWSRRRLRRQHVAGPGADGRVRLP